jgi:hypothetical protein
MIVLGLHALLADVSAIATMMRIAHRHGHW